MLLIGACDTSSEDVKPEQAQSDAVTATPAVPEQSKPTAASDSAPSPTGVVMAPAAGQSEHFAEVAKHLHLGGDFYVFFSFENLFGEWEEAFYSILAAEEGDDEAQTAKRVIQAMRESGLEQIQAVGVSSYRDGPMYENRMFLKTSGHDGLLGFLGKTSQPFRSLDRAPADTALLFEVEIQFKSAVDDLMGIAQTIAKEIEEDDPTEAMKEALKEPVPSTDLTIQNFYDASNTHMIFAMRFDPKERLTIENVSVPLPHVVLELDHWGSIAETLLANYKEMFEITTEGERTVYVSKIQVPETPYFPVLVVEQGNAWVATSKDAVMPWLEPGSGELKSHPSFQALTKNMPTEGTAMTYISSEAMDLLKTEVAAVMKEMPDDVKAASSVFDALMMEGGIVAVSGVTEGGQFSAMRSEMSYRGSLGSPLWILGAAGAWAYMTLGESTIIEDSPQPVDPASLPE